MKNQKKACLALAFRVLGFLLGTVGLIMQMFAASVVGGGFMMNHNLAYFTIQTNLASTAIFGILAVKTWARRKKTGVLEIARIPAGVHLACTCYISMTMLGFWLLLAPSSGLARNGFLLCSTLLLHTVLPLMAIFDRLVFSPHEMLQKREILWWLIYPAVYLLSVYLLSFLLREPYYSFPVGDRMVELWLPYPFLDPGLVGLWGVVLAVAGLLGVFLLLGLLMIRLECALAKKTKKA